MFYIMLYNIPYNITINITENTSAQYSLICSKKYITWYSYFKYIYVCSMLLNKLFHIVL